ncbi:MAG: ATPase domain-containing protein [Planctomycetota bacterium]|nr:ATPase domain-containing protein [Planctomycetota bacterium]
MKNHNDRRLSTGIARLDEALGGGLLPGTLTMVVGATGVGKTQFGMHFFHASASEQGDHYGTVIDLSSRGDSQNHPAYYERMFGKSLSLADPGSEKQYEPFADVKPQDILPFLGYCGRRVLRSQMDIDQWQAWQSELNRRMPNLFRFVYSHLVHGTRRFIIDGIEPQDDASESLQLDLLEMIYHRMLRKEHDWLAREVFRENFMANQEQVQKHVFDHQESAAMVLVTTKQSMLEQLMTEPLSDGDLVAGANTVLLLGRQLMDGQMKRGLYISKHRGSYADSNILNFEINDQGLQFK